MNSIDKNDVDISVLFNWGRPITLTDESGNELFTFYIRLVGDAEINRSRTYALRKSAELRDKLKTPGTDERAAYLPNWEKATKEVLVALIQQFRLKDLVQKVVKESSFPLPAEPKSDASLEKHEQYQQTVDEWPDKKGEFIKEKVNSALSKEKISLNKMSKLELLDEAEFLIINELCEQEMLGRFQEMVMTFATYKDPEYTERVFNSVDEFQRLLPSFREQLFDAYETINIDIENLKKLQEATQ